MKGGSDGYNFTIKGSSRSSFKLFSFAILGFALAEATGLFSPPTPPLRKIIPLVPKT